MKTCRSRCGYMLSGAETVFLLDMGDGVKFLQKID
jgi:hypothetical protein